MDYGAFTPSFSDSLYLNYTRSCYNAAKYIDNCFQSLENQTIGIKNLEIIFVNDASTDNTLKHLMDFEQKHPFSGGIHL